MSYMIFYGRVKAGIRLSGPKLLVERIEDAHQQASEWLTANPELEILSISNGAHDSSGANAVYITVWYRAKS